MEIALDISLGEQTAIYRVMWAGPSQRGRRGLSEG